MDKFLKKWSEKLDDLEVNLGLGEAELTEAFEKQKANFTEFLNKAKEKVDSLDSNESMNALKTKLDELQVQLALGKAEGREAFEKQKENLDGAMSKAQEEYQKFKSEATDEVGGIMEDFNEEIEHFRTKFDLFRLQYSLGKADLKDKASEKKKELEGKLQEMRGKMNDAGDEAGDKMDTFGEEMSKAYDNVKSAIKSLFD